MRKLWLDDGEYIYDYYVFDNSRNYKEMLDQLEMEYYLSTTKDERGD